MDFLEELFTSLWQEPDPKTEEYLANKKLRDKLYEKVEGLSGADLMDIFMNAHWEYMELECQRFFLNGIRLGLELLRL